MTSKNRNHLANHFLGDFMGGDRTWRESADVLKGPLETLAPIHFTFEVDDSVARGVIGRTLAALVKRFGDRRTVKGQ